MTDPDKIRNYFIYDDRLRRTVSIITGILIILFNFFSGYMLIYVFAYVILKIKEPGNIALIIYLIFGVAAGAGILKFCIFIFESLLNGVEIEKYSYLRMILLFSIAAYFFMMFFYTVTISLSFLKNILFPILSH